MTDTKECTWSEDEDGAWDTQCHNRFYLCEGTPEDNKMSFCCYCGRKLEQFTYDEREC